MSIPAVGLPKTPNVGKTKSTSEAKAYQQIAKQQDAVDSFEKTEQHNQKASTSKKIGVGLASFLITGLGQAVNGQWGKAAGFFVGGLASLIVFPPLALGVGIWSIVDAVKNA